jgi:3-hydroxyisobutyrate dehydrogenase
MGLEPDRTIVGFIGTGVMGGSMAERLLRAGYRLLVHNRTPGRAHALLAAGAGWREDPGAVAGESDVVLTMLGYPQDVAEVYAGAGGLLESARPGTYLVDMTTSKPALAERIWRDADARGLRALDAPVSGGASGAREARLSIMVGGEPADFEVVRPLLERLGSRVVLQGGPGAGQHAKLCNQIALASAMVGVCEALAYARGAGLEPARVLQSMEGGAAASWALSHHGPRMLAGDFEAGFYVKHFLKDMGIALEAAEEMELDLPGLELARMLYQQVEEMGLGDAGTQALFALWDDEEDDDTPPELVQLGRR